MHGPPLECKVIPWAGMSRDASLRGDEIISDARRGCGWLHSACFWLLLASPAGCGPTDPTPRPSILLVVIDTLRADAVSAWGGVE